MADVACRFSKMAHVPFLFSTMEREKGERPQPVGRGFKNVVGRTRQNLGRDKETRFLIVDAQSVKNTDTAQEKGYDAGKKVSGIKRHIAVDTNGLPHMIHLTTADAPDRAAAIAGLAAYREGLGKVEKVLADGGYAGSVCRQRPRPVGSRRADRQTQRAAYLCRHPQAMGRRTLFCVA